MYLCIFLSTLCKFICKNNEYEKILRAHFFFDFESEKTFAYFCSYFVLSLPSIGALF